MTSFKKSLRQCFHFDIVETLPGFHVDWIPHVGLVMLIWCFPVLFLFLLCLRLTFLSFCLKKKTLKLKKKSCFPFCPLLCHLLITVSSNWGQIQKIWDQSSYRFFSELYYKWLFCYKIFLNCFILSFFFWFLLWVLSLLCQLFVWSGMVSGRGMVFYWINECLNSYFPIFQIFILPSKFWCFCVLLR